MKLTESQIKYGFGKCRKCAQILVLNAFRQWTTDGGQRFRAVQCSLCEQGLLATMLANEIQPDKGMAYFGNTAFIDAAKSVPCCDCKRSFPTVCMDFDHNPEFKKEYNVSSLRSRRRDIIAAEIEKCDVVCACCHRIRTAKRKYAGTGRPRKA